MLFHNSKQFRSCWSFAALICLVVSPPASFSQEAYTTNDLFKILDRDRDGDLNPYEALDVLLQWQAENDNSLTIQTMNRMLNEFQSDARQSIKEHLNEMDRDNNGKVTMDEVDEELIEFARLADKNKNGEITVDEAMQLEESTLDIFLTAEEIEQEVKDVYHDLDKNRDRVLTQDEADEDLSWDQISEADTDRNDRVTPAEFKTFLTADNQSVEFSIVDSIALMEGVINSNTPAKVLELIFEHPHVRTIVMKNVPGSIDDEANLRAARLIRKFGYTTVINSSGTVASGGTDFFLAGSKRIVEQGGKLGIHSWGGPGFQGKDVPKDDPQHQLYLEFYRDIGIPAEFYWRTLEAAPADDIHWMTEEELEQFKIRTKKSQKSETQSVKTEHGTKSATVQSIDNSVNKKPYILPDYLIGEARMIMALLDQNDDYKLQRDELDGDSREMLRGVDSNRDGVITTLELSKIVDEPANDLNSKLTNIDTFQNSLRIVNLPEGIGNNINRHFKKYTNVMAPNGKAIHFLAMDGWSEERILRVRKVMEHFLTDVPGREWGSKSELANTMANNHATMVLLNNQSDMDRVLPQLENTNLMLQDLRANESPFEGEDDYIEHRTRDAAYEEVFHLIHGSGIIFSMRAYDREIRAQARTAASTELWNFDEPNMPGNHFEYIICVYDNFLDLWKTNPKMMESERIDAQPENQSFNGEYKADSRESTKTVDPSGFALIEKFNPPFISYSVELPENFDGEFSLSEYPKRRYSDKAKHLINATLRGGNASNLTGNHFNNRLVGNQGANVLTGKNGDDAIFGGNGNDTAVYRGSKSQYTINRIGDSLEVLDSMVNRDGYDVLSSVEFLKFEDVTLAAKSIPQD